MINIAIDVIKKIEQKKGSYYVQKLTSAFYYLIKFEDSEVNNLIKAYTKHPEYLVSYNAKRVLDM